MIKKVGDNYKLIVIIVKKGLARDIIKACKEAGAEGGTVFQGKGVGSHETGSILGIKIEPEKNIILSLVENSLVEIVLRHVSEKAEMDKPGTGIGFVINSRSVTGIAHLLEKDF